MFGKTNYPRILSSRDLIIAILLAQISEGITRYRE